MCPIRLAIAMPTCDTQCETMQDCAFAIGSLQQWTITPQWLYELNGAKIWQLIGANGAAILAYIAMNQDMRQTTCTCACHRGLCAKAPPNSDSRNRT